MKKINVVITIARQINGEYVFVRPEKAFIDANEAQVCQHKLKNSLASNGKITVNVNNEQIDCFAEIGLFELELEE